jgi:Protein of unknown function (DUF4239)
MFGSPHVVVTAVVIVGLSVLAALLVLWLVRREIPHNRLTPHNEVSGFVYAAIGVIYAVILGFMVISVWEQYSDAESNARQEADAVGNLYRLADGLPQPSRQAMQGAAIDYASAVVDEEWPAMADGTPLSQWDLAHLDALWSALYTVEATTPREQQLYAAAIDQMDVLSAHRLERLEDADSGLLGIMWAVMIVGGLLTVLFPCLFGVENGLVHALIIGTLAAAIGLLLFTVYELDHPFQGDVHVQPDGFELVLEQFGAAS